MKFQLLSLLTAAGAASAAFSVTQPSKDIWWVAKSSNVFAWSCNDSPPASTFTVLIANDNVPTLKIPMPFIAIVQNADCSKEVTTQQADQPAGTGYRLLLANTLNNTDVYATSDEFEIKPLGSTYPSQETSKPSSGAGPSGSASGSAPAASQSGSGNGALKVAASGLMGALALAAGLVLA